MSDRQPRLHFSGDLAHAFTSPRELSEHERGLRDHAVAMDVIVPVGKGDNTRIIEVPLDREALIRLIAAASGALAVLDGIRTR